MVTSFKAQIAPANVKETHKPLLARETSAGKVAGYIELKM
jgi:hypothetical protein